MRWLRGRDENGKWRLERLGDPSEGMAWKSHRGEHVALVKRFDADVLTPARYRAEVVAVSSGEIVRGWRCAPGLFESLKAAQLWCERELRMMEIGELG